MCSHSKADTTEFRKFDKLRMGLSRDMAVLLPKLVNEFIGTFFLVLVVCITGTNGDVYKCTGITPAVAIGGMLMVTIRFFL